MIHIADSITKLDEQYRGTVLVAGSHGGQYCGYLAAQAGLRGVIFNDAGAGKDNAGIGALDYLENLGIAAATVAHTSARIGDGKDMMARGQISHYNQSARELGCQADQTCSEAAAKMCHNKSFEGQVPQYAETRTILQNEPFPIIACDSASLVKPDDTDAFIITGSHGGVIADRPGYGIATQAKGAIFNDAGIGIDQAGIQRLEILNKSGIPAATVDAMTARIGDARSTWETGILSHINTRAQKYGIQIGMTVPQFAEKLNT